MSLSLYKAILFLCIYYIIQILINSLYYLHFPLFYTITLSAYDTVCIDTSLYGFTHEWIFEKEIKKHNEIQIVYTNTFPPDDS